MPSSERKERASWIGRTAEAASHIPMTWSHSTFGPQPSSNLNSRCKEPNLSIVHEFELKRSMQTFDVGHLFSGTSLRRGSRLRVFIGLEVTYF
jgi:hypothetical protein